MRQCSEKLHRHKIKSIHPQFHLEILTADQLGTIRSATLHILEHVGVHFPSERALRVFIGHGARVDVESQVVRLSPELVPVALAHAPRSYVLSRRAEGTDLILDGANSYFGTETGA